MSNRGKEPTEGISDVPHLIVPKSDEKTVGDKLDVLAHELGIHTDEGDGEGV
jgi:hypothetical protein